MLVLSRRVLEKVVVLVNGERLTVSVERIKGGSVRLGFVAPDSFKILRGEVLAETNQEKP